MPNYLIQLFSDVVSKEVKPTNIRFKAILTGSADGKSDYEYLLKSFNGVFYSGKTNYLTFIMPYSTENLSAYNDRPNGDIQLFRIIDIGGDTGETLIAEGNPQTIDFYRGAIDASFKLSATKQTTNATPKTYDLENVINIALDSNGARIYEVAGYTDITAGDEFIYEAETMTAEQIVMIISATQFKYKIKEQL